MIRRSRAAAKRAEQRRAEWNAQFRKIPAREWEISMQNRAMFARMFMAAYDKKPRDERDCEKENG